MFITTPSVCQRLQYFSSFCSANAAAETTTMITEQLAKCDIISFPLAGHQHNAKRKSAEHRTDCVDTQNSNKRNRKYSRTAAATIYHATRTTWTWIQTGIDRICMSHAPNRNARCYARAIHTNRTIATRKREKRTVCDSLLVLYSEMCSDIVVVWQPKTILKHLVLVVCAIRDARARRINVS